VLADGTVGNIAVETSSGHDILDQPAMDAVRQWRFVPAKKGGKPVDSWSIIPIKFNFE
jgi:protein TonB